MLIGQSLEGVLRHHRSIAFAHLLDFIARDDQALAIDAAHESEFGIMVALHASEIIRVPIEAGVRELKTVDPNLYDVASVFFG